MKVTTLIKSYLAKIQNRIAILRHQRQLQTVARPESATTIDYLATQLRRTYDKRHSPLQERTKVFVDKIAAATNLQDKTVLCIGCRNVQELHYFRSKGARQVQGIDLFSEDPAILVMDMHQMNFADHSFDLVYSSHSLEHAHTPAKVAQEILRVARPNSLVAIEIPIRYQTRGADLIDLQSVANLHQLFQPHITQVLLQEEEPAQSPTNATGTPIARTIFTVA
jgi:SAM-dependent methyltransferase